VVDAGYVQINPAESGLMLVEPLFTLSSIQKATDELVFEDFGFQSFCVTNSAVSTHAYQAQKTPGSILARGRTSFVVDSGFSFTHAAPVFQNKVPLMLLCLFKIRKIIAAIFGSIF